MTKIQGNRVGNNEVIWVLREVFTLTGVVGVGGYFSQILLDICHWPLRAPTPSVYSVANYRPHLSHFCGNVNFVMPT